MALAVLDSSSVEPLARCSSCQGRLVDISRKQFRFQATLCPEHRPTGSGAVRIGVALQGSAVSQAAEQVADGVFESVVEIDYRQERLSRARPFVETTAAGTPTSVLPTFARDDQFTALQVDGLDGARMLVRRRRSRKHGFAAQIVAAYQSYLYGRDAGLLEVLAFSLCSLGWRLIQRERGLEPGAVEWVHARVDELIAALEAEPEEYARWKPSLCTVTSQLALSRGDAETALRYADAVLAEPDFVERCPITAYNVVLNLCLATYVRYWRNPKDRLDFALVWETLFKRIVAAMDIRFGTMYEFKVIYDVTFMVTRLTLIRRGHSDPRLQPVTLDEFVGKVFRVGLAKAQRQRIIDCLGVAPDAVHAPGAPIATV